MQTGGYTRGGPSDALEFVNRGVSWNFASKFDCEDSKLWHSINRACQGEPIT